MKKSFFPVILAALVLLSTSCIKNVESDGVKAVRTGQAALLNAQATAATTLATSTAALNAATAALTTAQANVATAQAATETAKAAGITLTNAATAETNRHAAAVNALNEALLTAQNATDKAKAVDALAQETANSAIILANLAQQKADLDAALAKSQITSQQDLAAAQLLLDQAKLTNAQALAASQQANIELLAKLKASGLSTLGTDYSLAFAAYIATQVSINDANVTLIGLKASLATAKTSIADSTTVKAARSAVKDATTSLAAKNSAVVDATTNDNAALALIASAKAAKSGTPLGVILTANQAKLDAEKIVYANLYANELVQKAQINDADAVAARAAAATAENNALTAKTAAALDTVAKKTDVTNATAAVTAAKADTVVKYTAYKVTASWEHLNAGASFAPPRFVTVFNAPAAELEEAVGGVWNSVADRNEEANAIAAAATSKAAYDASKATLVTAQATLATANTAFTTSKTAFATAKTAYDTAVTAHKVLTDALKVLQDADDVLNAKLAASNTRILNYTNFIALLNTWIISDPSTTDLDLAIAKAVYAEDNTQLLPAGVTASAGGTLQLLATAKGDVTTAKAILVTKQGLLADAITSYTSNLPLSQNSVVYLTAQIADQTTKIANLTSILAQQNAVVNMWLGKIADALK